MVIPLVLGTRESRFEPEYPDVVSVAMVFNGLARHVANVWVGVRIPLAACSKTVWVLSLCYFGRGTEPFNSVKG